VREQIVWHFWTTAECRTVIILAAQLAKRPRLRVGQQKQGNSKGADHGTVAKLYANLVSRVVMRDTLLIKGSRNGQGGTSNVREPFRARRVTNVA
jgi:hypothetical protein